MLTKDDIKLLVDSFATRYDLNRYPTKEDLKDELNRTEKRMVKIFNQVIKEIRVLGKDFNKSDQDHKRVHKGFDERLTKIKNYLNQT